MASGPPPPFIARMVSRGGPSTASCGEAAACRCATLLRCCALRSEAMSSFAHGLVVRRGITGYSAGKAAWCVREGMGAKRPPQCWPHGADWISSQSASQFEGTAPIGFGLILKALAFFICFVLPSMLG